MPKERKKGKQERGGEGKRYPERTKQMKRRVSPAAVATEKRAAKTTKPTDILITDHFLTPIGT